jgi:Tfp pilus assembly PilM family ATPase
VTAISQGLNIDASDVPHLLTTYGLPAENGGNSEQQRLRQLLGDMISDPMKKLVDELTKTTQYLKLQWGDHAPEQLLLIGGGGAICNVDSYLAESLELPVACWRLPGAANSAASPGEPPQQILANAIALSTLAWQS